MHKKAKSHRVGAMIAKNLQKRLRLSPILEDDTSFFIESRRRKIDALQKEKGFVFGRLGRTT